MATETEKKLCWKREFEQVEKMAEKSLANHQIKLRHMSDCRKFAHWRCSQPNTTNCYFDISIEPGRLFMAGDLGSLVVERTENMIAWCRGSIDSVDYFEEKVESGYVNKEWSQDTAEEWIEEERKELRALVEEEGESEYTDDKLEKLNDLKDCLDNEHLFASELWDSGLIDEWPGLETWTGSFLWKREAIKWFVNHVDY